MGIFDGMSLPNFSALANAGYQAGREAKREEGVRNAFASYLSNPDDPSAIGEIARYDPQTALRVRADQTDRMQTQQRMQMDRQKQTDARLADGKKAVGQVALQIANLPPDQQAQAWDSGIDYLVGQGYDGLAQFKGRYSPESLRGVLAESGLAGEYQSGQNVNVVSLGNGQFVQANKRGEILGEDGRFIPTSQPTTLSDPASPPPVASGQTIDAFGAKAMRSSLGEAGFEQWKRKHGVTEVGQAPASRSIGGKTYYQVNGKWFDNPEGR